MVAGKKGRPISESTKDYMLRVRLDSEELKKLDAIVQEKNLTRSEVVRKGIEIQYGGIKK